MLQAESLSHSLSSSFCFVSFAASIKWASATAVPRAAGSMSFGNLRRDPEALETKNPKRKRCVNERSAFKPLAVLGSQ